MNETTFTLVQRGRTKVVHKMKKKERSLQEFFYINVLNF